MGDYTPMHSSIMSVRFQDCDHFTHLNNGRYVDYFHSAQVELFDALGNLIWRSLDQRATIARDIAGWASGLYLWRVVARQADGVAAAAAGRFVVP